MKSPVRENCTPGSVRRLSGNWQSYRDPQAVLLVELFLLSESHILRGNLVVPIAGLLRQSRQKLFFVL